MRTLAHDTFMQKKKNVRKSARINEHNVWRAREREQEEEEKNDRENVRQCTATAGSDIQEERFVSLQTHNDGEAYRMRRDE